VITIAKRDLKSGENIDTIGGYTVYGGIERSDISSRQNLLPLGIAEGAKLTRDIQKGESLTFSDVEPVDSLLFRIKRLQERKV
jgi:predicted homoserine dehydrogenase-like protein